MRIYFDGVDFGSRTGPNSFALRLARQLSLMGHTVADPDDYDVALVFVEATPRLNLRRPYVHRLDGFWMKPSEFESGRNAGIKATYDRASAVVWQSEFDRGRNKHPQDVRTDALLRLAGVEDARHVQRSSVPRG